MSDAVARFVPPATARMAGGSASRRLALMAAVLVALAAGFLATDAHVQAAAIHRAGPDLTRLLRGMAVLKALMTAGAVAATLWRFGTPVPAWRFALYALACAATAAGPGLVWGMAHLYAGSIAMNGGLVAAVLLFWRDPEVGRMLAAEVSRRRARLEPRA